MFAYSAVSLDLVMNCGRYFQCMRLKWVIKSKAGFKVHSTLGLAGEGHLQSYVGCWYPLSGMSVGGDSIFQRKKLMTKTEFF